jgi:fructokinase
MITEIFKMAEANKEGFTIELDNLTNVTTGIVVAFKETQNSFGIKGLRKCVEHALTHDKKVGGWFNQDNKKFYFDSVKTFTSLEKAIEFGKENGQIAIFDLGTFREIRL